MNNGIYLLLGSNLGDKRQNLVDAVAKIDLVCLLTRKSAFYKSQPWGKIDQPDFINQLIEVSSSLSPTDLLQELLAIEQSLGRERTVKWGERVIDIDILFYQNQIVTQSHLTIPHPEIQNRKFALLPLAELAPHFVHPLLKKTMTQLLNECADPLAVEKIL